MKDMNLKIKYGRTDTGCLTIFVYKGNKWIADLIVFPDDKFGNRFWLELPNDSKAPVSVHPHDAIER
jgi:hypothetical protein